MFLFILCVTAAACSQQPKYPEPPLSGNEVIIDIASLGNEEPAFYTYRVKGRNVNFFLLRINDKVLSFLDACITCYPRKQGYRHEDVGVTCRACNTHYSIYKLEKGIGGCYPIKLEGRADKGKYHIPIAALEKMSDKF